MVKYCKIILRCPHCPKRYHSRDEADACRCGSTDVLFPKNAIVRVNLPRVSGLHHERGVVQSVIGAVEDEREEDPGNNIHAFLVQVKIIKSGQIIHVYYDQLEPAGFEAVNQDDEPEIEVL